MVMKIKLALCILGLSLAGCSKQALLPVQGKVVIHVTDTAILAECQPESARAPAWDTWNTAKNLVACPTVEFKDERTRPIQNADDIVFTNNVLDDASVRAVVINPISDGKPCTNIVVVGGVNVRCGGPK